MTDYNQLFPQGLYLAPDQQDLLLAALTSNTPSHKSQNGSSQIKSEQDTSPDHAFGFVDDSPFLDFHPDVDFEFPGSTDMIGDLPESAMGASDYELGEKRKSIDGQAPAENEETGKKRRESEAKKPGRKPLTSEPTTKRKAQNRAAQRAFRERKERHLRDLETKVEELQKSSDMANEENGFLRSQVERLQVELREYRKRISWMTSNPGVSGVSAIPGAHSKGAHGLQNGEFLFDFPKFGDLPAGRIFNNGNAGKNGQNSKDNNPRAPGVLSRDALASPNTPSPVKSIASPASRAGTTVRQNVSSPVGAGNAKSNTFAFNGTTNGAPAFAKSAYAGLKPLTRATWDTSTSDSPSSSSDSHQSQLISSSGTSPEPSLNSPHHGKTNNAQGADCGCGTYRPVDGPIDGEKSFCAQLAQACGDINNPIPAARDHQAKASVINIPSDSAERFTDDPFGFDWLAQQNGGQFDPVLFGDWREPQDAVLSQDFGTFFNDAFPLPDLGSPSHNLTEVDNEAPKKDLLAQIDGRLDEEVVPGEDKSRMLNCTKIWDHLQSNPRFQNGDIDVDSLCSELTKKAKCSEGGVVVNQKDVEDIMGRAK